jgi:hypothetical protein
MIEYLAPTALTVIALLLAFASSADNTPGVPLYPDGEQKARGVFAVGAVILAFIAGLSL